jgi:nucleotide-binding universal stress UspA family protein
MFDKILVAVGGADASYEPARVAGRLASLLGAELTIVSVQRHTADALGEPYYSRMLTDRLEESEATLNRARRTAEAEGAVVTGLEALDGPAAERILDVARIGGFNMIVMGTRRLGRLQSAILGSVSAAVAAHSQVPVMVGPEPAAVEPEPRVPQVAGNTR